MLYAGRDGSGKCSIVAVDDTIHVAIYEFGVASQRRDLDRAESLGVGYAVETLDVDRYGACFTYVAIDTHVDDALRPFSWYKRLVIAGCERLDVPRAYRESIEAVESWEDPDRERHARHIELVADATDGPDHSDRPDSASFALRAPRSLEPAQPALSNRNRALLCDGGWGHSARIVWCRWK